MDIVPLENSIPFIAGFLFAGAAYACCEVAQILTSSHFSIFFDATFFSLD